MRPFGGESNRTLLVAVFEWLVDASSAKEMGHRLVKVVDKFGELIAEFSHRVEATASQAFSMVEGCSRLQVGILFDAGCVRRVMQFRATSLFHEVQRVR